MIDLFTTIDWNAAVIGSKTKSTHWWRRDDSLWMIHPWLESRHVPLVGLPVSNQTNELSFLSRNGCWYSHTSIVLASIVLTCTRHTLTHMTKGWANRQITVDNLKNFQSITPHMTALSNDDVNIFQHILNKQPRNNTAAQHLSRYLYLSREQPLEVS